MKTRMFGFLVISSFIAFSSSLATAQQSTQTQPEQKTKLEAFQLQTGAVVIKGFSDIGGLAGTGRVEVSVMEFTDVATKKKQTGVKIEINESGQLENSDTSFIDYDEIGALLQGLDYISKVTSDITQLNSFEAHYTTSGNFDAVTFNDSQGKINAALRSGRIRPATAYFSIEQFYKFIALIKQAKEKLDLLNFPNG